MRRQSSLSFSCLPILLLCCCLSHVVESASVAQQISNQVQAHHDLGIESPSFLTKMITHMFELFNLKQVVEDIKISKTTEGTCHSCKFGIGLLQHLLQFGRGRDDLGKLAHTICVSLRIESPRVCNGIVQVFKDEFVTVIAQLTLSPSEICGIILGDSCAHVTNPLHNWTLPLTPFQKPAILPVPSSPAPGSPTFKMLQLSDTHIDLQYVEGASAVCGEPLCCRENATAKLPANDVSGYWGDYRDCDIPMRTLEAMVKAIALKHKDLDFVIWTGDVPAHDVWNQTRAGQLHLIRSVSILLDQHFGHLPLLPALGNHESAPVNSFPRPEVKGVNSVSWLYDELDTIWSKWLPAASMDHIKKGAYYSVPLKRGLKLVSLNMNYCNNQNWWLLLNTTDPADELTWLINELQESELLGERVLIIGHIPPGSNDCLQVWSSNYYRIINRYENTISGQFFGHTHQDEFQLFYDQVPDNRTRFGEMRATSVAYVAPSATTFGGVNPGYRIYTIDAKTFDILDYETYYVNLTSANRDSRETLEMNLSYDAKNALSMTSMHPSQWHLLILNMIVDPALFQKFEKLFFNQSDVAKHCRDEDSICKADLLCRLVSGKAHDYSLCQKLIQDYQLLV